MRTDARTSAENTTTLVIAMHATTTTTTCSRERASFGWKRWKTPNQLPTESYLFTDEKNSGIPYHYRSSFTST
jgi:hypothetical protein